MAAVPAARGSLHDLSFAELEAALVRDGLRPFHTKKLWGALHRLAQTREELLAREDFAPPLARWLKTSLGEGGAWSLDEPEVTADIASSDGYTRKLLLKLQDGQTIETVVMRYPGRHTACISTQAGCAMGCVFCATGQMGFVRHLRAGEIIAQVLHAQRLLRRDGHEGLRNLVLMGMGEPLHNYDTVMRALASICDTRGPNIGPSRVSISTVGVVPGILRMAEERSPYHLAVSLHAASDAERSAIMPANQRWPLTDLMSACRRYCERLGRRIFIEWTLIAGKNDSPETAERVAALLAGVDAHINLIPLNPTAGFDGSPTDLIAAGEFQQVIQRAGYPCTIRQRRGIDVAAGCGQLRAEKRPNRKLAAVSSAP